MSRKPTYYPLSRTRNAPCGHDGTCGKRKCVVAYYGVPWNRIPYESERHALTEEELLMTRGLFCQTPGCGRELTRWEYHEGCQGRLVISWRDPKYPLSDNGTEQADVEFGCANKIPTRMTFDDSEAERRKKSWWHKLRMGRRERQEGGDVENGTAGGGGSGSESSTKRGGWKGRGKACKEYIKLCFKNPREAGGKLKDGIEDGLEYLHEGIIFILLACCCILTWGNW